MDAFKDDGKDSGNALSGRTQEPREGFPLKRSLEEYKGTRRRLVVVVLRQET